MSRDHRKLRAFCTADRLVIDIYRATNRFPVNERYGLQSQVRRAAVSAASNIVEGCARRTTADYVNFLNVAAGSSAEARYLMDVSARLGFVGEVDQRSLDEGYALLSAQLEALIQSLSREPSALSPEPTSRPEP